MKLYREVDILNNKKAIILFNIGSILLSFIVGTLFFDPYKLYQSTTKSI
ncbi:hypothetical protein [Enterococcus sp. AZ103]